MRINPDLPGQGDVLGDFAVLSGGRVLYRADQEANDVFELFLGFFDPAGKAGAMPLRASWLEGSAGSIRRASPVGGR
jgi:hypothetical protein